MNLSDVAIQNLKRLWVSDQPQHIKLAITMSDNPSLLHEELMPECILAKEFHPDLTTRLYIEDFLNKKVYGLELREWRERVKFFQPPHQVFLYKKYKAHKDAFEHHFLTQPHLYEKYKETAIHCSYSWGQQDKLRLGLELFEHIIEKEPDSGDMRFFLGRCHHYIYMTEHEYGATLAIQSYQKALDLTTAYSGQIEKELATLMG